MSEVAAVSSNLAGLHEYRLKIIAKTENSILDYIIKYQPIKYIKIAQEGHFSRRALRKHLDELERKGKIAKMDSYYYVKPIDNELLNSYIRQKKLFEFSEFCLSKAKRIKQLVKKWEEYRSTQPMRYALAMVKTTIFKSEHNHIFRSLETKSSDEIKKCTCGVITVNGEILYPRPINDEQRLQIRLEYENARLEEVYHNLREFFHHFKLYSEIEKPRFKKFQKNDEVGFLSRNFKGNDGNLDHNKMIDWYKPGCGKANNPLGINPDFLKLDGSIDYDKIERVHHNRREMGSWHMVCTSCGNEESVYVADEMNAMIKKGIRRPWHYKCLSCGKISHIDILGELHEMFESLKRNEEVELKCNFH